MDHLFKLSTSPPDPEVPCVTTTPYPFSDDLDDWYKFPARQGWHDWDQPERVEKNPEAWLAFIQTWLYFGTLTYLLRRPVTLEMFTKWTSKTHDSDGKTRSRRICTKTLKLYLLEEYRNVHSIPESSIIQDGPIQRYFIRCLKLANDLIVNGRKANECFSVQSPPYPSWMRISLSIKILASLCSEASLCMGRGDPDVRKGYFKGFHFGQITNEMHPIIYERFQQNGWCVESLYQRVLDFSEDCKFILSGLKRRDGGDQSMSHASCTKTACLLANIDENAYEIKHATRDCTCGMMREIVFGKGTKDTAEGRTVNDLGLRKHNEDVKEAHSNNLEKHKHDIITNLGQEATKDSHHSSFSDSESMLATTAAFGLIEKGHVPLVTIIDQRLSTISFDPARKPRPRYVAFSHVWADGRGNPNDNAPPFCQLLRLQEYADYVCPIRNGPTPFWIDTICVPVRPQSMRKAAITLMAKVFASASQVCALDSELLSVPLTKNVFEIALRVHFSRWRSRLWTYQESYLAREIVFMLNRGGIRLRCLHNLSSTYVLEMMFTGITMFYTKFSASHSSLRKAKRLERENQSGSPLFELYREIAHCTTSRIEDEPICAALLLGQDVEEILRPDRDIDMAEARMEIFYGNLSRIPLPIIFSDGPKLSREGYRWAPKSLLNMTTSNLIPPRGAIDGAVCTQYGLKCRTELYLFSDYGICQSRRIFICSDYESGNVMLVKAWDRDCSDNNIKVDHSSGTSKRPITQAKTFNPFTSALIMQQGTSIDATERMGILVSIRRDIPNGSLSNELFCRIQGLVDCNILDPSSPEWRIFDQITSSTYERKSCLIAGVLRYFVRAELTVYID